MIPQIRYTYRRENLAPTDFFHHREATGREIVSHNFLDWDVIRGIFGFWRRFPPQYVLGTRLLCLKCCACLKIGITKVLVQRFQNKKKYWPSLVRILFLVEMCWKFSMHFHENFYENAWKFSRKRFHENVCENKKKFLWKRFHENFQAFSWKFSWKFSPFSENWKWFSTFFHSKRWAHEKWKFSENVFIKIFTHFHKNFLKIF